MEIMPKYFYTRSENAFDCCKIVLRLLTDKRKQLGQCLVQDLQEELQGDVQFSI
jgi:hypothetical protein